MESNPVSLRTLAENAKALGAGAAAVVHRADALRFVGGLAAHAYGVAFADPPYRQGLAVQLAERWLEVPFARYFSVEHEADASLPAGGDTRRYGGTAITFYRAPG